MLTLVIGILLLVIITCAVVGGIVFLRHRKERYSNASNYAMLINTGKFPLNLTEDESSISPDTEHNDGLIPEDEDDEIGPSLKYTPRRYRSNGARRTANVPLL